MLLQALAPSNTNRQAEVWEFPIPGGLVLAVPGLDGLFFLNPSAEFIWKEWRSGSAAQRIATRLRSAFSIAGDVAARDVSATLEHWAKALFVDSPKRATPAELPLLDLSPVRTFHYRLNCKTFRIILDSADLEQEILPRLSHLAVHPSPPDFTLRLATDVEHIRILCGPECVAAEGTLSAARAVLLQEMVRLSGRDCEWLALLHAGACGSDSACVVFPAPSSSGKSTLAAVLMQSGFAFQADDSVGVSRRSFDIPPMPFGLAIREGSWSAVSARFPNFKALPVTNRFGRQVRFLAPASTGGPVPAAALVFPLYDPDSSGSVTPLGTLDRLVHLKESGFWVEHTRESIQGFLDWIQSVPAYRIVYSDVEKVVSLFRKILTNHVR